MTCRRLPLIRRCACAESRLAAIAALVFLLSSAIHGYAADSRAGRSPHPCSFSDSAFVPATDVNALDAYEDAISQLLKQEKFADLECLADAARTGKTRFSGGIWKLREIYDGLGTPRPGQPTADDWKKHLKLIERWTDDYPDSNTARIALAQSYVNYGWDARGGGTSDDVSQSGWKLLHDRMEKAKKVLDEISTTNTDPTWYLIMQQVAQGEDWDLPKTAALFQQAAAFEPDFQYYYRMYAFVLQPKWSGQEGDAARFAGESADRVGGDAGDILYFQIAAVIACACQESEFGHFSWPRLQRGFAALEKKFGPSLNNVNSFALMACKFGDWEVADAAFKRMGDNWQKDLWITEAWFKQNRDTAAQVGPMALHVRTLFQSAEANMQTPEGLAYRDKVRETLVAIEKPCMEKQPDPAIFQLLIQVEKDGSVSDGRAKTQSTVAQCVLGILYASHLKNETVFPPPPKAPYAVVLDVNPATVSAAAK
ncbi:MAG TPA: hypothetical protein VMD99_08080 [Terriglobales bacterium]|nr:hypothetical protein [Terriglobales bacterium]